MITWTPVLNTKSSNGCILAKYSIMHGYTMIDDGCTQQAVHKRPEERQQDVQNDSVLLGALIHRHV